MQIYFVNIIKKQGNLVKLHIELAFFEIESGFVQKKKKPTI